jgi:cation diffusion facilitator CzcD-associated flavoprotein CzcO
MAKNHVDVLILGAGLSGIGAAAQLTRKLPHKRYAILERRDAIGGTWDLFRYPGIRSDSDMSTFGFSFRPWRESRVLADGPAIKQYLADTAAEYGVTPHIHFGRKVTRAEWSSENKQWTVTATHEDGNTETWTAQFLIAATGYYAYDAGFTPEFPGRKQFKGQVVHPQHWPQDLDYTGKKIVVIGSGATAITLVPSLVAGGAGEVTMLQRSPTYVLSVPSVDPIWKALSKVLPVKAVYAATRLRNIGLQRTLFLTARRAPAVAKRFIAQQTRRQLKGQVDLKHFTPRYNPWDERLCVVPDGDLFRALRKGQAKIVTDTIQRFDAKGITLDSGDHLEADIIVTATGLNLQLFGGAALVVDGKPVDIQQHMAYKGMMMSDIPNLLAIFGYTNASWTLKADIVTEHFLRMIAHMDKRKLRVVTPRAQGAQPTDETVMGSLSSGYVRRGAHTLPRQGSLAPWAVLNDYLRDAAALKLGSLTNKALEYRA